LPGKPTFGSKLTQLQFAQLDHITINIAKRYIKEALRTWESRVLVEKVEVQNVPEYNKIVATITYSYKDKDLVINDTLSLNLTQ
jgi:phage baseplate assembly protein W